MSEKADSFEKALEGKNIPVLTLDHKWHQLFTQAGMTEEIEELANHLNELVQEQGRLNNEEKKVKKIKNKLMDEIVQLADEGSEDELKEHKRLIEECNEKLDANADRLIELPREIAQANRKLMLSSMEVCYERMKDNSEKIDQIEAWLTDIRIQLKKNVIRKQRAEKDNAALYSYMHDVFGAAVIELFDMKYDPEEDKKS
ncbi:MAG: hypothetical protein K6A92_07510 [Lachnospiraceae bacterium]|nr:hypothetical protein [Lachnospiraceae bacterium]